jgi:hypothetical protein
MSKYSMQDGAIINTESAQESWPEKMYHDGKNCISVHTGSQWTHETLYRSRKGRYYIVCGSQWQGSKNHAEWLSPEAACRWLLLNGDDLPADLAALESEVSE